MENKSNNTDDSEERIIQMEHIGEVEPIRVPQGNACYAFCGLHYNATHIQEICSDCRCRISKPFNNEIEPLVLETILENLKRNNRANLKTYKRLKYCFNKERDGWTQNGKLLMEAYMANKIMFIMGPQDFKDLKSFLEVERCKRLFAHVLMALFAMKTRPIKVLQKILENSPDIQRNINVKAITTNLISLAKKKTRKNEMVKLNMFMNIWRQTM